MKKTFPTMTNMTYVRHHRRPKPEPVFYYENYGVFSELIQNGTMVFDTGSIRTCEDLDKHFFSIHNIFKDAIWSEQVQKCNITLVFADGEVLEEVKIGELYINLIFWNIPIMTGKSSITSEWWFWKENFTQQAIEEYINDKWLKKEDTLELKDRLPNIRKNQIIDDTLYHMTNFDEFATILGNSMSIEDFLCLRAKIKELGKEYLMRPDLAKEPLDKVTNIANGYTSELIQIIKEDDDISMSTAFRANEMFNKKQFRELAVGVGVTVDGTSQSVFPFITDTSFIDKGLDTLVKMFIEFCKGREALMMNFENVGTSGSFARLLSLNNMNTFLNDDEVAGCDTVNFLKITVKNERMLNQLKNRYYRYQPDGPDYKLNMDPVKSDRMLPEHQRLVGKTIYLRSPITCNSHAHGKGICRRCYGDLYFTNKMINCGQIAAEWLSEKLTQRMLSAKHLLESNVVAVKFNEFFDDVFMLVGNVVKFAENVDTSRWKLVIPTEFIVTDEDESETDTSYYITQFYVENMVTRERHLVSLESDNLMYITGDLLTVMRAYQVTHKKVAEYSFTFDDLAASEIEELFTLTMFNNGLNNALIQIKSMINKGSNVKDKTKEQYIIDLADAVANGGIDIDMVHLELIVSNQIRGAATGTKDDIITHPDWGKYNTRYQIISLGQALKDNPSIAVSLEYQFSKKLLTDELNYQKTEASNIDMIMMTKPQLINPSAFPVAKQSMRDINNAADTSIIRLRGRTPFDFGPGWPWPGNDCAPVQMKDGVVTRVPFKF